MKSFIKADDSWTENDLYTKRSYNFNTYFHLSPTYPLGVGAGYPLLEIESTNEVYIPEGSTISIDFKVDRGFDVTTLEDTVCGTLLCRLMVGRWSYGLRNGITGNNKWYDYDQSGVPWYKVSFSTILRNPSDPSNYISRSAQVWQKFKPTILSEGHSGYQIPVTIPICGKLRFMIITYRRVSQAAGDHENISAPITTFSINISGRDIEFRESKNVEKKTLNKTSLNTYDKQLKIGTYNQSRNSISTSIIIDPDNYPLNRVAYDYEFGQDEYKLEDWLMYRIDKQHNKRRKIVTINVRKDFNKDYSPFSVYSYNGDLYRIVCKDDNWVDQTVKLTLVEIEK